MVWKAQEKRELIRENGLKFLIKKDSEDTAQQAIERIENIQHAEYYYLIKNYHERGDEGKSAQDEKIVGYTIYISNMSAFFSSQRFSLDNLKDQFEKEGRLLGSNQLYLNETRSFYDDNNINNLVRYIYINSFYSLTAILKLLMYNISVIALCLIMISCAVDMFFLFGFRSLIPYLCVFSSVSFFFFAKKYQKKMRTIKMFRIKKELLCFLKMNMSGNLENVNNTYIYDDDFFDNKYFINKLKMCKKHIT